MAKLDQAKDSLALLGQARLCTGSARLELKPEPVKSDLLGDFSEFGAAEGDAANVKRAVGVEVPILRVVG